MAAKRRVGKICVRGGVLLLAASLLLTWYLWAAETRAHRHVTHTLQILQETAALQWAEKEQESPETASDIPSSLHQDSSTEDALTIVVDGIEYLGILEIPDVELTLPVISQWSYPHLKLAPCRYSGLPQESGFVLAGHNYCAHFGPIDQLTPGARVQFTEAEDSAHLYQVKKTELLSPTAVEEMTAEEWDLTLFTCDFSGKTRIAVRCQKDPTNG